jgi:hypothetical protein
MGSYNRLSNELQEHNFVKEEDVDAVATGMLLLESMGDAWSDLLYEFVQQQEDVPLRKFGEKASAIINKQVELMGMLLVLRGQELARHE